MNRNVHIYLFCCAAALAQPAIEPPSMGAVRDGSGRLQTVMGVPGNFMLAGAGISGVISAAFSGSAGLVKTDTELVVVNARCEVVERSEAPAGPALFAFDSTGAPALVYYSGILRGLGPEPASIALDGDVVSIASTGPHSAAAIVRRADQLWTARVALDSATVENETLISGVSGPVFLLPGGDLLFTRDSDLVMRDQAGAERTLAAGFEVEMFESMGKDWVAVRERGGQRLYALRITPQDLELYQLPEVAP